jgi:murein DD-endopeptidase MepM/ murein hydrolase activator NlpD
MPRLLLLLLTAALVCAVPSGAQKQALTLTPVHPRQGDALFIRLDEPGAAGARIRWRNRTYPLYPQGDSWIGAAPVSPDTPAGGHTLAVTFTRGGAPVRLARKLEVARVAYPVQRLRMSGRISALYSYPGVEKEDAAVSAAIRTRSGDRLWSGDWMLPVQGRLSTPFGVRRLRNGRPVGRHRGLDIAAPTGTPVMAPAAGRVVLAKSYRKHGKTVILDHGMGITSFYIHMSAIHVQAGETVSKGASLGEVGSTGVSTGPHLHWSVYVHGTPLEPRFFCRLSRRGAGW